MTLLHLLLFILALVCVVYAVQAFLRRDFLVGVALLIVAALVGPGGYSLFG